MLDDVRKPKPERREWIVEALKDMNGIHTGFLHKGELIRCGDCKWLRYCETEDMVEFLDCDHPDGGGVPRSEEWFCADGEREEDE